MEWKIKTVGLLVEDAVYIVKYRLCNNELTELKYKVDEVEDFNYTKVKGYKDKDLTNIKPIKRYITDEGVKIYNSIEELDDDSWDWVESYFKNKQK